MESKLSEIQAEGLVLDLGGGGSETYKSMQLGRRAKVITSDIRLAGRPTFISDFEVGLPVQSDSIDVALLLNVLEHIYNYQTVIREVARVLKPGGVLYLFVPFLYPIHTANHNDFFVDDYYRYGPTTLRRLLAEVGGFSGPIEIETFGYGPFVASASIVTTAIRSVCVRLFYKVAVVLDHLFFKVRRVWTGRSPEAQWPLAYWVKVTK